jgi:predicted P-loop ATPase
MEQFQLTHCKQMILDSLSNIFNRNQYHPVKEYLESLEWDGKSRCETFLQDVFLVDDNIYTKEVFKLFLVAGISRIYNPGCKYDCVLILQGHQGVGKSGAFRLLAKNPAWHLEDLKNIGKPGIEQIQGKWIVEISELSAMKKSLIEDFKSFITITRDNLRLPYAKRTCDLPRQCIFAGTTNEATYLKDKTGNRRFMPVESKRAENDCIDFKYVESIVDQLWAEAMVLYKKGYHLDLSDEAKTIANSYRDAVMDEDAWVGMIENHLTPPAWGEIKIKRVCVQELWDEVVGHPNRKISEDEKKNIRAIMSKMPGWESYRGSQDHRAMCGKYGKQYCWERIIVA